ncbi:hypothetical protein ACIA8K_19935 [Catenuloplanes sp. NPDC051500]|uniref:hypothetical protein n=1 Tax=Catenuloplanes sp. NPDC051500 TaxID=3363959 RepID=UPI00378C14D3
MTGSTDQWVRVAAAHAFWRVTDAIPVLRQLAAPLTDGEYLPIMPVALGHLAEIGAAEGVPIARAVLGSARRLCWSGGWRGFLQDEELLMISARMVG